MCVCMCMCVRVCVYIFVVYAKICTHITQNKGINFELKSKLFQNKPCTVLYIHYRIQKNYCIVAPYRVYLHSILNFSSFLSMFTSDSTMSGMEDFLNDHGSQCL